MRQLHSLFRFSARSGSRDYRSKEILVPYFTFCTAYAGGWGVRVSLYLIENVLSEVQVTLVESSETNW